MLSAFTNCLKIPELRDRILFTLALLFVARVGANIPLPGVDPTPLQTFFEQQASGGAADILGLYNMFTGGALLMGAIFALGIMPYISAAIIFQLLGAVIPTLARLQQEGDVGRQKISQYTRYATIGICVVQGVLLILALQNPGRLFQGYDVNVYGDIVLASSGWFLFYGTVLLTAGGMLLMWLGEQITEKGIGNGISLLITVGILADLPGAASATYALFRTPVGVEGLGVPQAILMLALLLGVIAGIVAVVQGERKIPVQYAKRVVGRRVYGGQSSYMPLKVNYSGVMPVIFASAILLFPQQILAQLGAVLNWQFLTNLSQALVRGSFYYYLVMATLILLFSYFWVSVMFKPIQIADDLKKYGGYVPGIRPGAPTAKYLDFIMTRLTLAGAIFLTVIAVLPDILLFQYGVPNRIAIFFGGTGMLITVGVVLMTMQQIETYLLQRHYDGFLRKGRIRGRSPSRAAASVDTASLRSVTVLWSVLGLLFVVGMVAWVLRQF